MANERRNIFISHIHEDDSKLKNLKDLLAKNSLDVSDYSINSDRPNRAKSEEYIKNEILAPRINQCSVLVVYVSKDTKDSEYVNWEIEYALKNEKRIVGVWEQGERGCEMPEALKGYADAVAGWNGNNIVDAVNGNDSIRENLDGSPCLPIPIKRHPC